MAKPQGARFYGYKHWTLEETPRCFYVGKGRRGRANSHCNRGHKWLAIVRRYGLRVEVCIGPVTNEEACAWEIEWIVRERTYTQCHDHDDPVEITCNFTHGGDGSNGSKPMLGKGHSAETRRKLSALSSERRQSPETKLKISLSLLGRKKSPETRARMSLARRRRDDCNPH